MLVAVAATFILSRLGILHGVEHLVLDAEMGASPEPSGDIAVVSITDADYDNIFGGRSPLSPMKLHDLIDAIALSDPAVIAVDIDTSHPQFQGLNTEFYWPATIWERDVSTNDLTHEPQIEPLDVLGGKDPSLNESAGIPALLDDPDDKVTRLYTRCVDTKAGLEWSFVSIVVTTYQRAKEKGTQGASQTSCATGVNDPLQPFLIRYSLRPGATLFEKDAAQVLGISAKKESGGLSEKIPEFNGRIVLLGGTYRDFDRHTTPIGTLIGVRVLANAIQTELNTPVKALPWWGLFALEFLAGFLMVLVFHFSAVSLRRALIVGVLVTVVVALGFSYASFRTLSRFANFAPTLLAVLVFEIYEYVRDKSVETVIDERIASGQSKVSAEKSKPETKL
jgi:CHASE2 domain-containing sensor protein